MKIVQVSALNLEANHTPAEQDSVDHIIIVTRWHTLPRETHKEPSHVKGMGTGRKQWNVQVVLMLWISVDLSPDMLKFCLPKWQSLNVAERGMDLQDVFVKPFLSIPELYSRDIWSWIKFSVNIFDLLSLWINSSECSNNTKTHNRDKNNSSNSNSYSNSNSNHNSNSNSNSNSINTEWIQKQHSSLQRWPREQSRWTQKLSGATEQ